MSLRQYSNAAAENAADLRRYQACQLAALYCNGYLPDDVDSLEQVAVGFGAARSQQPTQDTKP